MEEEFRRKQLELTKSNQGQEALVHLKTKFDSSWPGIELICDKLVLFAGIWSSVGVPVLN